MKTLAIVPARSGSKGLKNKNILSINGTPLIGLTGDFIKSCRSFIDKAVISTDSDVYIEIGQRYGLEAPFKRPENISGDNIGDLEVLIHALHKSEKYYKIEFDFIIMLQPTAPVRKLNTILEGFDLIKKGKYDAVWSISEINTKYHPLKQLQLNQDKIELYQSEGMEIVARQQLSNTYIRNGQFYIFTRNCLINLKTVFPENTGFILTPLFPNIDDINDFQEAEKFFK